MTDAFPTQVSMEHKVDVNAADLYSGKLDPLQLMRNYVSVKKIAINVSDFYSVNMLIDHFIKKNVVQQAIGSPGCLTDNAPMRPFTIPFDAWWPRKQNEWILEEVYFTGFMVHRYFIDITFLTSAIHQSATVKFS